MSDARARTFERAADGGDPEARARWLAERVRRGALGQDRLRIAAWAGDVGARLVLGLPRTATPALTLVPWVDALRPFGNPALLRAGVAALSTARPTLEGHPPVLGWLDEVLAYARLRAEGQRAAPPRRPPVSGPVQATLGPVVSALDLLVQAATSPVPALVPWRGRIAGEEASGERSVAALVAGHAAEAVGRPRVRAAIKKELLAWAVPD
jgi:hypothetical protein